jgi:hypothetical protein
MPRPLIILATAAVIALAARSPAATDSTAEIKSPLVKTILKDWDRIDTNHDGVLTVAEIDRAVTDPAITGDTAAAVAALKLASVSKSFVLPRLTREYFLAYDRHAPAAAATQSAESATADPQSAPHVASSGFNWNLYFSASRKRLQRGGPDRWTGRFDLAHVRQGPLGDCYFVAAIGSLQVHDPARLEKLITPAGDGQVSVHFGNGHTVDVVPPTDTEIAISSTTTGDGVWLADLEQAFGRDRANQKGGDPDTDANLDGTDLIRNGGDSGQAIGVITGHRVHRIHFARTLSERKAKTDTVLPELRRQIQTTIAAHRVVTAGVNPPDPVTNPDPAGKNGQGSPPPVPPDITKHHVYAVVSYDPDTDIVEIWNPHGQQFKPRGEPGLANGYPTDHGLFKLPLAEAYQFFTSFTFETDAPVQKAK